MTTSVATAPPRILVQELPPSLEQKTPPAWMSLAVGVLSTRYRDIPQLVTNFIQVMFFLTPIFWSPLTLPNRPAFVTLNPFYHLIEIVRAPLLGDVVSSASWALCIGMAAAGLGFTAWLYRRAHARIAYWV